VIRFISSTTTAITRRRWIRLPATWKLKPKSHNTSSITKIVHNILSASSEFNGLKHWIRAAKLVLSRQAGFVTWETVSQEQ
jgi:hypothetical protein